MKQRLTYNSCRLGLHVVAYTLLLVPFILLLLPAFQPVTAIPLFSVKAQSRSVLIGAQGICAQDDEGIEQCVARGYNAYAGKVPTGAINQAGVMLKTSNGPLLIGILALAGLGVGLIGHIVMLALPKAPFRRLRPPWRALTMRPANLVLLGLATWTLILGAVDLSNLITVQRSLRPATQVGPEKGSFHTEIGFSLSMAAVAIAGVALIYVVLLTVLWNDTAERTNGNVVALGNHFVVIEAQGGSGNPRNGAANSKASEEEDEEMEEESEESTAPADGDTSKVKVKKDLPMNEAIDVVRKQMAQSAHPPKIAHEVIVVSDDDDDDGDSTKAADGRPLQEYIDAEGHKQREMIAADISSSPTSDSQMPTPKELKDEDHPAAEPVWKGHGQIKHQAKPAQPAPDFHAAARPAFTPTPAAPQQKPPAGIRNPVEAHEHVEQHHVVPITAVYTQPKEGKPAAIRFADDPVPFGKEAPVDRGRATTRQKPAVRPANIRVANPARKHTEPDGEPPSTPLPHVPHDEDDWLQNPRAAPPAPAIDDLDLDSEPLEPVAPLKLHRNARR